MHGRGPHRSRPGRHIPEASCTQEQQTARPAHAGAHPAELATAPLPQFKDEPAALKLKHDAVGVVGFANSGERLAAAPGPSLPTLLHACCWPCPGATQQGPPRMCCALAVVLSGVSLA